jgi:SAM-dependent methyltransferase
MLDGGYEAGYVACPCFWGHTPGSLVTQLLALRADFIEARVLDAGCGEGKNAYAMAQRGCKVDAVDCSSRAIAVARAQFDHPGIAWRVADVSTLALAPNSYDIIIAYGLLHCLPSPGAISGLVARFKAATRPNGFNVVCAFDNGPHDLSAHEGFRPTLLSHQEYLALYAGWQRIAASSSLLYETHPHNRIPHFHSLTRLLVVKHEAGMPS